MPLFPYMGIMEKKMETTIMDFRGFKSWVLGLVLGIVFWGLGFKVQV